MFRKLKERKEKTNARRPHDAVSESVEVPDGMYEKCPQCGTTHQLVTLQNENWVCSVCDFHFRMHVADRVKLVFDDFKVFGHVVKTKNPLDFPGYQEKLDHLSSSLGVYDAVVCANAKVGECSVIALVMDTHFMMGSMGSVVGEKITAAFEYATKEKKPVILFSASGGARMQEGIISLMQMAKTSGAIGRFSDNGGLFISVLTDPTTGGVTASFAMLGDIILAEPGALIGFAGPRVIEQTIQQPLPSGFQRAEFLLEKGFVDMVVHRHRMKQTLIDILEIHEVRQ